MDNNTNTGQPYCQNMPNDEPEGHYWAWCNDPQSLPNEYRKCMTCGRIDATEWLESLYIRREKVVEAIGGNDEVLEITQDCPSWNDMRQQASQLGRNKLRREIRQKLGLEGK